MARAARSTPRNTRPVYHQALIATGGLATAEEARMPELARLDRDGQDGAQVFRPVEERRPPTPLELSAERSRGRGLDAAHDLDAAVFGGPGPELHLAGLGRGEELVHDVLERARDVRGASR